MEDLVGNHMSGESPFWCEQSFKPVSESWFDLRSKSRTPTHSGFASVRELNYLVEFSPYQLPEVPQRS